MRRSVRWNTTATSRTAMMLSPWKTVFLPAPQCQFHIISPDMNPQVIQETVKLGMVSIPGAFSATEIAEAAKNGADYVKVFPAVSLGPEYLKAIKGPLNYIPLMVVGGISYKNIDAYMEAGAAGAGIGGEIANKKWVESGEFEKITEAARLTIEKLHGGTHE